MSYVHTLSKRYDRLLFESYRIKEEYLSLYRILYCLLILFIDGFPSFTWISGNPDYFFSPPTFSLASFFHAFPGATFFYIIRSLIMVNIVFLLLGCFTKWTSLSFSVLLITGYSFQYSFGKIDHEILWAIIPLVMAFSGWGNKFSIDEKAGRSLTVRPFFVTILALLLGFAMFSAGIQKLMTGWMLPGSEAVRYHFFQDFYLIGRQRWLAGVLININSHILWKFLDYFTVFMETGFLLSILKPNIFRLFILFAVIFHIMVLLTFNIPFISTFYVYLLFINWHVFDKFLSSVMMKKIVKNIMTVRALAIIILLLFSYVVCLQLTDNIGFSVPGILTFLLVKAGVVISNLNAVLFYSLATVIGILSIIQYIKKNYPNQVPGSPGILVKEIPA